MTSSPTHSLATKSAQLAAVAALDAARMLAEPKAVAAPAAALARVIAALLTGTATAGPALVPRLHADVAALVAALRNLTDALPRRRRDSISPREPPRAPG